MRRKLVWALSGALLGALFSALMLLLVASFFGGQDAGGAEWWLTIALPACVSASLACALWALGTVPEYVTPPRTPSVPHTPPVSRHSSPASGSTRKSAQTLPKSRTSHHLMIARLDPALRWIHASKALQKFLHRPNRSLRGKSFLDWVDPEDVANIESALEQARKEGSGRAFSFRLLPRRKSSGRTPPVGRQTLRAPDALETARMSAGREGRPYYVRMEVRARFDAAGVIQFFNCNVVDVTDLVRAEQALRKRSVELSQANDKLQRSNQDLERLKESYRDLYHNAPIMFFSLDPQGRLVTFNDTLRRRLGYKRKELLKAPYLTLLAPAAAAEWRQADAAPGQHSPAHSLTRDREVETKWRMKNGAVLDVWIRSVPVLDEKGRFVRSRSAAMDLSERNQLANELRARGDELEQANTRLRQINAELEDFTHVVSHDLKEPLRTLQAFSSILARDYAAQLGPDGFECIHYLVRASRRLEILIEDLLQLGQAGRIAGKPQTFNLIEVVAIVRRDLIDLIQRKEASVLTEGSLPTVIGDQKRIAQLIANLVANALKYNKSPNPQVVIGAAGPRTFSPGAEKIDPNQAVIFVRDNGIGIDSRYHQQIFGIFPRLQPEEFEGTGAGLAICKKIVQAHGGTIWVESESGKGATFYFTLLRPQSTTGTVPALPTPTKEARARSGPKTQLAVAPQENGQKSPPAQVRPPAGRGHVLLVEDMEDVAAIIRREGQRSGLTIAWYSSAEAAWPYLIDNEPDLLLLDINLPGMNGIELCRKVRDELGRLDVPVVLFTREQDPEKREEMRQAGASHLLSKDLLAHPSEWDRKIKEILSNVPAPTTPPLAGPR